MGQHKYNPTARLAKEGKLPPKPTPISKRELERKLMSAIYTKMLKNTGLYPEKWL